MSLSARVWGTACFREQVTGGRRDGHTALRLAAFGNHTDMLKLMIENGADVNEKDE